MADSQFEVKLVIDLETESAEQATRRFVTQLRQGTTGLDKDIDKIEKALTGTAAAHNKGASAARGWSETVASGYRKAFEAEGAHLTQQEKASRQTALYNQYLHDQALGLSKTATAEGKQAAALDKSLGQRDAHVRSFQAYNQQQSEASKQTALYNKYLYDQEKASRAASQGLSTTRYALYDVSSTLLITGAALLAMSVATAAVAISWERDFAQVIRTTGVTGASVGKLRDELVELAQTMPVAFGDLTQIATLGGQLGVAQGDIASFTETVAKFSAVTDLSVEAAATAFGRLDALLPDVNGDFEALGSAIAKVGVESVATESQIVAISTQISSMAAFAGLTADEVIGLSGALASVGAAPELSRGTVTRLFSEMNEAVSEGGDSLEKFAKVAGVSSDQFATSFGTNKFGPVFQSFVEGLADVSRNGGDALTTLNELGISSVRDVPLLLRLAGAGTLLGESFDHAADGFQNATELNRQYGIIADTASAQIQRLVNSFQSFLDAAGSATLGPITDAISFLADAFANLADFASTDTGGRIMAVVTAMTALIGILTLVGGALALFGASSIGLQQGLAGIITLGQRAGVSIASTGTAAAIASGEMSAATVSAKALGFALKAISLIGIALVLPDIANWADEGIRGIQGISNEFEATKKRFLDTEFSFGQNIAEKPDQAIAIIRALGDTAARGAGDIRRLDEEIAALAKNGMTQTAREEYEALQKVWENNGGSITGFKTAFIDATAALEGSRNGVDSANGAFATLDEAMAATESSAQEAEQAINDLRDAVLSFGETGINAEQASINLQKSLNGLAEATANADASLTGTNQASLDLRSSYLEVDKAAREAALGMIENGATADEATQAYLIQRQAIIDSRIAKGEDADAAAAWADAVLGNASEAQTAIEQYSKKVNEMPETKITRFYVDASGAYRDTQSLIDWIQSRRPTLTITEVLVQASGIMSGGRGRMVPGAATGGHITGPGSGTSDSIPVRLSNGEFVIKAASVNKYGTAFMHAINSGKVPKFASGGSVGRAAPSGGMGSGIMELGPKTIKALAREAAVNVMIDDIAISRAAESGNAKRRSTGEL